MKTHPDAELFPLMDADEYARFADSVERDGLLEPITTHEGMILDGRHRQRACGERGIEPRYVEWDSDCGITPLEWVIAMNLHRRQLTTGQKAALAVEVEPRLAAAARERKVEGGRRGGQLSRYPHRKDVQKSAHPFSEEFQPHREHPDGSTRSRELAAEQFGISHDSLGRAKRVKKADPVVFEQLKKGELTLAAAQKEVGISDRQATAPRLKKISDALAPLRAYAKGWNEDQLWGMRPSEARRLLKKVQEVDAFLLELERALEVRAVQSRALK